MLKLSRKVGEEIVIDNRVIVTNLGINDKGEIVLGFTAPRDIQIDRFEVHIDKLKGGEKQKK